MKKIVFLVIAAGVFFIFLNSTFAKARAGMVIIRNDAGCWNFDFPEMLAMKADVMKFQMTYDGEWGRPANYAIPAAHVQGAIDAGAKVIIFRSAETKCASGEINHFISVMKFWDTGERIVDFIYNRRNRGIQFWIEVGNEPDVHGADPWVQRWCYLDTAKKVIPAWRWLTCMKWMASMPTRQGGQGYTDVFYTRNSEGAVQDYYDGLATHNYGYNTILRSDAAQPMWATDIALSRLPSGKVLWITEVNINNKETWGTKGNKCKQAFQTYTDSRIAGWLFWALTEDAFWNRSPYYYGIDRDYSSQQPVSGRPFAAQIATR